MGEAFWRRVVIAGAVAAAFFIYWPAIQAAARGDWLLAGVAAVGTTLLLGAIYWQGRRQ